MTSDCKRVARLNEARGERPGLKMLTVNIRLVWAEKRQSVPQQNRDPFDDDILHQTFVQQSCQTTSLVYAIQQRFQCLKDTARLRRL